MNAADTSEMKKIKEIKQKVRISSRTILAENIYRLTFETDLYKEAAPGQFVMVYSPDGSRLLGRPLCIEDASLQNLSIVFRAIGAGTHDIATCNTGDFLEIEGPFGNGYPTDGEITKEKKITLLGGGLGIPSLYFLAKKLSLQDCHVTAVLGYRDRSMDHFLFDDFRDLGITAFLATDDGSEGLHGNVLDVLKCEKISSDILYACGPMPMLSAVKDYASKQNIKAFISLEEHMACGLGVCLGCVVPTTAKDEHSNVYNARVCTEGPVFDADKVRI